MTGGVLTDCLREDLLEFSSKVNRTWRIWQKCFIWAVLLIKLVPFHSQLNSDVKEETATLRNLSCKTYCIFRFLDSFIAVCSIHITFFTMPLPYRSRRRI